MKSFSKLLALLLALLMLVSVLALTSCEKDDGPDLPPETTTVASDDETTPAPGETTAVPGGDLELVSNGTVLCTVVRDDDASSSATPVICASDIRLAIQEATGAKQPPKITTDWIKKGTDYDHTTVEVLVGATDYSESAECFGQLTYGSYLVKVVGKKLVVAAYSDAAISEACRKTIALIKSCAKDGNLVIPEDTVISGVADKDLNDLPAYEGGTLGAVYKAGNDATMIYLKNTNTDEYDQYLKKLQSAGYTEYTTNEITGNKFATYNNSKLTINAGYYEYEKAARIIMEPLAAPVGLESDNVYTKVTTSQITMLGLEYKKSDGTYHTIGLSMLIRLEDGRFIVIDGGSNSDAHLNTLVKALKEQSSEYLASGKKPTIAAWIITHPHGDHSGMIGNGTKANAIRAVANVEKFVVNFISDIERNKAINSTQYSGNYSSGEGGGWSSVISSARILGADVQYVHVGQVLYIADVKIDVLYTIESFAPNLCNALNTTSLVMKMTFNSGNTFLMTGDATGNALQICARMYKNYLKSDMVQVSHHGCSTWGNDAGTILAYGYMSPETLLWPTGNTDYNSRMTRSYNVVLFSPEYQAGGQNNSFKEVYTAGLVGRYVTVPLPYTAGNAIVINP